jgi:hypothetical protein
MNLLNYKIKDFNFYFVSSESETILSTKIKKCNKILRNLIKMIINLKQFIKKLKLK